MSAELLDATFPVLTIKVSGKLTSEELAASQRVAGELIKKMGTARLLIIVDDFQGMEKGGDWGDVSFQMEHDDFIERIAVVSEPQWKQSAMLFTGKGIRRVAIEHFLPAQIDEAQAWVKAD